MSTPPPLLASPALDLESIQDFPDRLPALLVRELRSRLKQPIYQIIVIAVPLLLALAAMVLHGFRAIEFFAVPVWIAIAFTLLHLATQAAGDLRGEIERGNFALLQLTGVDARRLIQGKWLASMAQVVLMAIAFTPWLAFAGQAGGSNPFNHLLALAGAVLLVALIAAWFLWMSSLPGRRPGTLVRLFFFFLIFIFAGPLLGSGLLLGISGLGGGDLLLNTLGGIALIGWMSWCLLGTAACQLSSESEDFLARPRLWAPLILPGLLLLAWINQLLGAISSVSSTATQARSSSLALLAVLVAISAALTFLPERIPRSTLPFRALVGSHAARLTLPLRPGFQAAVYQLAFAALCLLSFPLTHFDSGTSLIESLPSRAAFLLGGATLLLCAGAITRLCGNPSKSRHHGALMILWIPLTAAISTVIILLLSALMTLLLSLSKEDSLSSSFSGWVTIPGFLVLALLTLIFSFFAWRRDSFYLRRALHRLQPTQP